LSPPDERSEGVNLIQDGTLLIRRPDIVGLFFAL